MRNYRCKHRGRFDAQNETFRARDALKFSRTNNMRKHIFQPLTRLAKSNPYYVLA